MAAISTSAKLPLEIEHRQHPAAPVRHRLDRRPDVGLAKRLGPRHVGGGHRGFRPDVEDFVVGPVGLLRQRVEAPVDVRIPRHVPAGGAHQLVRLLHREEGEQIGDLPAEAFGAREACRNEAAVVRERFGDDAVGRCGAARKERRDVDDARGGEANHCRAVHSSGIEGVGSRTRGIGPKAGECTYQVVHRHRVPWARREWSRGTSRPEHHPLSNWLPGRRLSTAAPGTTVARIGDPESTIVREAIYALVQSIEPAPDPPVRRSGSARSRDSTAPSADPAVHGGSEVPERDSPAGQETVVQISGDPGRIGGEGEART